jgi:alanyl-tRNA synthetase
VAARAQVERVLKQEEERFAETLDNGLAILEDTIANLSGKVIPGETVFKLYDTYGFPVDLTADIARERNLSLDEAGFEAAMAAQRERARAASQFGVDMRSELQVEASTEFTGYDHLVDQGSVLALFHNGQAADKLANGEEGLLVLDRTPFYAESGGQVGDHGTLVVGDAKLTVLDTQKQGEAFLHRVSVLAGTVAVGDSVEAQVDETRRRDTACNHSATHLLHAALRQVLGEHVTQKGSLVNAERLRFDFSHFDAVTPEQLAEIENLVNEQIRANLAVETRLMSQEEAMASGAMALFGEKYGDTVRVLSMGDFSVELCGGTHVERTGDIGLFKIVSEGGVAAGVRRIEAVSGAGALAWVNEGERSLTQVASLVKGSREDFVAKVEQLVDKYRALEKDIERLKARLASSQGGDLASQAVDIDGIKVLAAKLEGADPKSLRDTVDQLKNKLGSAAVVLATVSDDKVSLAAGVTADQTDRVKAGDLVNMVAQQVGGKGGGRPDMAMAGGKDPAGLDTALQGVPDWVRGQLAS